MQIIHKLDNFLYTIFPSAKQGNQEDLIKQIQQFYTYGSNIPKVSIEGGWVKIEIDSLSIINQEMEYKKVISLCEKGKFSEAKPILITLISKNPSISEYHRIMGQILSEEGDQDEGINSLIDALRWDSKNSWALLMMGNIFAKYKNDISTAMKYYDQALVANPNDNITMNNIGANLLQQGKYDEAEKYFYEALKIDSTYPNTHYALGLIAIHNSDLNSAFYSTIKSIQYSKKKDVLFQNSKKQLFEIANRFITNDTGKKIYQKYRSKLEYEGDKKIDIYSDEEIPTAAKIEFAENYNRDKHIVKFNPNYKAVEHLIMHELVHLDFVIQARNEKQNKLYTTTQNHKTVFIDSINPTIKKLKKIGIPEHSIESYCTNLFDGLNNQIYNTPIDLFIEDYLYNEYPELRPYQFISLLTIIQESIKAVTDKKIIEITPPNIVSKSKIYNIVSALLFKDLFGFDYIQDFNATIVELKKAKDFFEEFEEYRDNKAPGEEYEIVNFWADDLNLNSMFELKSELEFRKQNKFDDFIQRLESDPFGINEQDPIKEREMRQFQKSHSENTINMAVVMFMVDALEFFEQKTSAEIETIAFDIAMLGTQGFRPEYENYYINSIPGKNFSGYHILAYYYVSWAKSKPELLHELQLPFDEEYKLSLTIYKSK